MNGKVVLVMGAILLLVIVVAAAVTLKWSLIQLLLAIYGAALLAALVPAAMAIRYTLNGIVAVLISNGEEPDLKKPVEVANGVSGPGTILLSYAPVAYWRGFRYQPVLHEFSEEGGVVSLPARDGNVVLKKLACRFHLNYDPKNHDGTAANVVKWYLAVGEDEDHDPGKRLVLQKAMEKLELATSSFTVAELTKGKKFPDALAVAEKEIQTYVEKIGGAFDEFIVGDKDTPQWIEDAAAVEAMAEANYQAKLKEIEGDKQEVTQLASVYKDLNPELSKEMDRDTIRETFKNVRTLVVSPGDLMGRLFSGGGKP